MTPRKKQPLVCSGCYANRIVLQRNTQRLVAAQNEVIKAKKVLKEVQMELARARTMLQDAQAQFQKLKEMKWREVLLNLIKCSEFYLSNVNYHQ